MTCASPCAHTPGDSTVYMYNFFNYPTHTAKREDVANFKTEKYDLHIGIADTIKAFP